MLKRTITYMNLEEQPVTRDFYFNLTQPELVDIEVDEPGGLSVSWTRLLETKDTKGVIEAFKKLILTAYGEKQDDGETFLKIDPVTGRRLSERFYQKDAYAVLFMELFGEEADNDTFTNFIRALIPANLAAKLPANEDMSLEKLKQLAGESETVASTVVTSADNVVAVQDADDLVETDKASMRDVLQKMSDDAFYAEFGTDATKWSPPIMQEAFRRKNASQQS